MSDFPQKSRDDLRPSSNSFPKKQIREGWGAENEAANPPNTPSMETPKQNPSINPYADYECD